MPAPPQARPAAPSPEGPPPTPSPTFHLATRNLLNALPTLRSKPVPLALRVSTPSHQSEPLYQSATQATSPFHAHPSVLQSLPLATPITLTALSTASTTPSSLAAATAPLGALLSTRPGARVPLGPHVYIVIRRGAADTPERPMLLFDLFVEARPPRTSRRIAPRLAQDAADIAPREGEDTVEDDRVRAEQSFNVVAFARPRATTFIAKPAPFGERRSSVAAPAGADACGGAPQRRKALLFWTGRHRRAPVLL